jgi:hypothetical protein
MRHAGLTKGTGKNCHQAATTAAIQNKLANISAPFNGMTLLTAPGGNDLVISYSSRRKAGTCLVEEIYTS